MTPAARQTDGQPTLKSRHAKSLMANKAAPPVEIEFLKDLLIQSGGQLLPSKMPMKDLIDKCAIVISADARLQRSEIDLKLTQESQRPSMAQTRERKSKTPDNRAVTVVDYHWIIDSIYCQRLLPLSVYKIRQDA